MSIFIRLCNPLLGATVFIRNTSLNTKVVYSTVFLDTVGETDPITVGIVLTTGEEGAARTN